MKGFLTSRERPSARDGRVISGMEGFLTLRERPSAREGRVISRMEGFLTSRERPSARDGRVIPRMEGFLVMRKALLSASDGLAAAATARPASERGLSRGAPKPRLSNDSVCRETFPSSRLPVNSQPRRDVINLERAPTMAVQRPWDRPIRSLRAKRPPAQLTRMGMVGICPRSWWRHSGGMRAAQGGSSQDPTHLPQRQRRIHDLEAQGSSLG